MGKGAGKGGRGGRGNGSGGRGKGGRKSGDPAVPRRAGEVGACAALGNHVFTISSGNKARDGDTLRTTKEAMVTWIGTNLGEETSREFATGVSIVLTIPPQDPAIIARHAARVLAHRTRLTAKIANLEAQSVAIMTAIAANPLDRAVLKERSEVEDELAKANIEVTDDLELVLTGDEKSERGNVYRTFREDEQRLITNRGKVYMLIIGQCTQTLKDKLKEDVDWVSISDGYDSIRLLALIEKYVLKQTESHYPYLAVQEEFRSMLNFAQGDDMPIGMYYEKFLTRISIAERAGCSFVSQQLLDSETLILYPGQSYDVLSDVEKARTDKVARDKYLGVLFLMRSGKRYHQLQIDIKNDHAKGVDGAFPDSLPEALQIMNDWKPLVAEPNTQASLGTAFVQGGASKKQSKGRLCDADWNALTPEAKSKLVQKRKDDKAKSKAAGASGDAKKSSSSKDDDDSSVVSTKSMAELQNENARLKKSLKKTNACLLTTISDGLEEDLTDDDGSQLFVAAALAMADMCPKLQQGALLAMRDSMDLTKQVLIDSQTTHDVFCNKKYVTDIRRAKRDLVLSTNGGGMRISQEADVPGLYPVGCDSKVYYDTRAITNILSFKNLVKKYRITYDSDEDMAFTVHRSNHGLTDLKFVMHKCGLHMYVHPVQGGTFVQTVEDNKKLFTKSQIARATEARGYYEALLCPSEKNFSDILNLGGIRGCKLNKEDADISFKIFGPSVVKGKGNTTRQAAKSGPSSIVTVPRELLQAQKYVVLCIDFFYTTSLVTAVLLVPDEFLDKFLDEFNFSPCFCFLPVQPPPSSIVLEVIG